MFNWKLQIKRYRLLNCITQAELAEILGVEQSTISRWERGNQRPDYRMRNQLIKLMRDSDIAEDLRKIHVVRSYGYPVALVREDMTFIAASKEACRILGVDIDEVEGLAYRSYASEDVEHKFRVAKESGFFNGDVASIDHITHGYSVSGEDIFFRALWSPERLCDGTYAAMVIAELLSRREYEQQRLDKGAVRIVTMADLLGKHEVDT